MRLIVAASLLALAACGSPPAPSSTPGAVPDPADAPQTNTQITGMGDGFHVAGAAESRLVKHDITAPVDDVWRVLPEVYAELGVNAGADAAQRTVSGPSTNYTRRMFGEPITRFFDCGRGQFGTEIASTHTIALTLRTTVQPGDTPAGARLETVASAYARNNDGANSTMTQCHSKGLLEGLIALRVREKVAKPAGS
jgi:hypothetical protein